LGYNHAAGGDPHQKQHSNHHGAAAWQEKLHPARIFTLKPPKHSCFFLLCYSQKAFAPNSPGRFLSLPLPISCPLRKEKSYPLKLHLSCYRHRPSPQSLKITAHSRGVGFTLPARAQRSRQLGFQREPNHDSFG